ncbi:molybdopterin molybdenumtransferase MoeA, partial [Micromonospora yasonensis]|nr:molybdopterin molybdenumtransferase MoeA [Micromonospora yasonensis]
RRTRILPVRWSADGLHPVGGGQPGFLGGAAGADAFAVVPPGWRGDGPVGVLRLRCDAPGGPVAAVTSGPDPSGSAAPRSEG